MIGAELGSDLSSEVYNAFVDGARARLYELANNSAIAPNAIKENYLRDFRAIVGGDLADAMLKDLENLTARANTYDFIREGQRLGPDAASQTGGVSPLQNLADYSIISQYLRGNATGVAPAFAARRQLGSAAQDLTTTRPREARVMSEALTTPVGRQTSGSPQGLISRLQPGTTRASQAMTAALGSASGSATGEAAGSALDYLEGIPPVLRDAFIEQWRAMNTSSQ